jgi:hypothetical protein
MMVLLIEGTYGYAVEMASSGMIYVPSSMKIGSGFRGLVRLSFRNFRGCDVDTTDARDL